MAGRKRKAGGKLNAFSSGLFARGLVIPHAGESEQEFEQLRLQFREQFNPQNSIQEIVVEELLITYWRLRRVRHFESAQIEKHVRSASIRSLLVHEENFHVLRDQFLVARRDLNLGSALATAERLALERAFVESRRNLESVPLGVDFLIEKLTNLKAALKFHGYLQPYQEIACIQICGPASEGEFREFNRRAREEAQKVAPPAKEPEKKTVVPATGDDPQSTVQARLSALFKVIDQEREASEGKASLPQDSGPVANSAEAEDHVWFRELNRTWITGLEQLFALATQQAKVDIRARCELNAAETGLDTETHDDALSSSIALGQTISGALNDAQFFEEQAECAEYEEEENATAEGEQSAGDEGEGKAPEGGKPKAGKKSREVTMYELFMLATINERISGLKERKIVLGWRQGIEGKPDPASPLLLPPEMQDKLHRAETSLQRHLLKLLSLFD